MSANPPELPSHVNGPAEARQIFAIIADAPVEIAMIAYLDRDQLLLALDHVAGTEDSVELPARRVVAGALNHDAASVIIGHNHPSGDPHPSRADITLAQKMAQALKAVEVRLEDFMVLAGPRTTSMRALGLL